MTREHSEKFEKYFTYRKNRDYSIPMPVEEIVNIDTSFLGDEYKKGDLFDRFNTFFVLLNEYYNLREKKLDREAAYVCYLISYYLFMLLHPPTSWELCKIYASKAVELDKGNVEYVKWKECVDQGN